MDDVVVAAFINANREIIIVTTIHNIYVLVYKNSMNYIKYNDFPLMIMISLSLMISLEFLSF